MVFDESLMVPDPEKSLEQGAILPWRRGGKRMIVYYKGLLRGVASHYQQSMEAPYKSLPEDFQHVLLWGSGETEIAFTFWRAGKTSKVSRPFEGVIPTLQRIYKSLPEDFQHVLLWGSGETEIAFTFWRAGKTSKVSRPFEGVIPNLQRLY